jgi:hypothetical protein
MTTLIVNIEAGGDARKIAETLSMIKGVAGVSLSKEAKTFKEAATECNAVSLETFDQMFAEEIRKAYSLESV